MRPSGAATHLEEMPMICRLATAAVALALAVSGASAQQPPTKTLKMQATWPTSVTA
jgi:hypothetical protein